MRLSRRLSNACAALVAALLLAPAAASAEAWSTVCRFGTTGLVKGDMTVALYKAADLDSDLDELADPGITVTESTNTGEYIVAALPDAGDDLFTFLLNLTYDSITCTHVWPPRTRTPQSIAWNFHYGIVNPSATWAVGDTAPELQVDMTGLSSDPTGGTLTFSLWCPVGQGQVVVVDAESATISNIVEANDLYSFTATYDFQAGDLATAGNCAGRFKLVVGGETMTLPPRKALAISVVP